MDMENEESGNLLEEALLNPSFCDPRDVLSDDRPVANLAEPLQNGKDRTSWISNFFRKPPRWNERSPSPDSLSEGRLLSPNRQGIRRREASPLQRPDTFSLWNEARNVSKDDVGFCDESYFGCDYLLGFTSHGWWICVGFLIFWSAGFYAFIQLMHSPEESSKFMNLLYQQSNRLETPSQLAHLAFSRAYPIDKDKNNSVFVPVDLSSPLVIVLNGTAVNRVSNMSASNNDTDLPICSFHSKFTRRGTPLYDLGRSFSIGLEPYITLYFQQHVGSNLFSAFYQTMTRSAQTSMLSNTSIPLFRVFSYYSYIDDGVEWLANSAMATEDGSSVLIQIFPLNQREDLGHILIHAVDAYRDQFLNEYMNSSKTECFTVETTGSYYFGRDLSLSIRRTIWIILLLVIPVSILTASFILSYYCHANLRAVWIIPTMTILSILSLESMIVHFLRVLSGAPLSIVGIFAMIVFSVGLGTNCYIYFLVLYSNLCYSQENCESLVPVESVRRALRSSGSILMACLGIFFLVLFLFLLFPIPILQDVAIGTLFGVSAAVVTNFTITPPLLAYTSLGKMILSPRKLSSAEHHNSIRNVTYDGLIEREIDVGDVLSADQQLENPSNPVLADERYGYERDQSFLSQMLPSPSESLWFNIARSAIHPYRGFIFLLIILQFILPMSYQLKHVKFSVQLADILPRNYASKQTYTTISERLGWGRVQPHRILFDGHNANVSMTTKTGFAVMHFVLDQLRAADMLSQSQRDYLSSSCSKSHGTVVCQHSPVLPLYYGVSILRDTMISHDLFVAAQYCTAGFRKSRCPLELLRLISATDDFVTASDRYATYVSVLLATDPYSKDGIKWLVEARDTVDRLNRADLLSGVRVYIEGPAGGVYDASTSLYAPSRIEICLSALIVIVVALIFFQSVVVSIRCLLLYALFCSFSMGLLVSVYQNGFLNWTKVAALSSIEENGGCYWLVPFIAFPVIVGFGLPGDFFILHRILEYRLDGYERKSSIALGLDSTGVIVCGTGILMALVCGTPLLVSSIPFIEQLSFVVTTSVLLNGLAFHTLVVPASTAFIPFFWWPRSLPQEKFCLDEFSNRNPFRVDDGINVQHNSGTYWEALVASSEYEPLSPYR